MSKGYKCKNIKCSTGEIAIDYNAYLKTKHWKELRERVAINHNYTCLRCYGIFKTGFNLHHNTYKRMGFEKDSDLGFYCKICHSVIHNDRKNKRDFNRQHNAIIQQKMCKMSKEQIEKVLEFIDSIYIMNEPKA